ncbi:MAG: hypothetical protein AAFU85_12225 [Planctomycetota bacterium]
MQLTLITLSLLFSMTSLAQEPGLPELNGTDGATRMKWLIDGMVVDSRTGQPLTEFQVTPGTLSIGEDGKTIVRWRDNLKIVMREGRFRWPRTSGFSEMRFRVTSKGYRPLVTPAMRRGGPYARVRVRLTKE